MVHEFIDLRKRDFQGRECESNRRLVDQRWRLVQFPAWGVLHYPFECRLHTMRNLLTLWPHR